MKSEDKSKLCTKHVGCSECCCDLQNRFAIKHISLLFSLSYLLLTSVIAFCLAIYHHQHQHRNIAHDVHLDIKNNFYENARKNGWVNVHFISHINLYLICTSLLLLLLLLLGWKSHLPYRDLNFFIISHHYEIISKML